MGNMAIRVVEFSNGGTKFERFAPKKQHPQRKWLNFENWISGGLRVLKINYFYLLSNKTEISIKGL